MARAIKPHHAPSPPPKKKAGGAGGLFVVFIIGWLAGRCSVPEPAPVEAALEAPATASPAAAPPARPSKSAAALSPEGDTLSSAPPSTAPALLADTFAAPSAQPVAFVANESAERALYVSTDTLTVREGPGAEFAIVGTLKRGDAIGVLEQQEAWARVSGGWVSASALSESKPRPQAPTLSDARIRDLLIQQSLSSYSGSCPCPYNVDRGGRSCGARSAYSRPGGASPFCYRSDISDADVQTYRARNSE